MKRAAVLIGVDKTGDLPRLKDAAKGARLMHGWAQAQGIESVLLVDDGAPVTVRRIKDTIRTLVDRADIEQLVVYFAGHGVNIQRQEYWLLSEAPDDTQEAVNVFTSATLAATCGIAHVVLMSDACRTAPEGVRAQSIRGSEIFPNREEDARPVDQFFACQLGKPSHEIRDPNVTSAEFRALYTHELVPALLGRHPQIVEWADSGAGRVGHVHLRPLRDHLSAAVTARLADLQLQTRIIQVPVAQISSDPPAWISQVAADAAVPRGPAPPAPAAAPAPPAAPQAVTTEMLRQAIAAGGLPADAATRDAGPGAPAPRRGTVKWFDAAKGFGFIAPDDGGGDLFAHHSEVADAGFRPLREGDAVEFMVGPGSGGPTERALRIRRSAGAAADAQRLAQPFGPASHETACGFKLRGARAVDVQARVPVGFAGGGRDSGDDLRVGPQAPASNVLLVLDGGAGVLLPAIPDFLCALSFDDGELVDVAYEPSANTWRWGEFQQRAREMRALRAIASSSMARGSFKLEGDDALAIARRMQMAKGVDPSLGLYAAYAYHDLQRRDLIRQMAGYMAGDLGAPIFDVALLARALDRRKVGGDAPLVIGAVPLLAQGWPLLRAFDITLPPALASLEAHRQPSLWTMFDAPGVERIRHAFATGELS